ncbi:rhamnan synthesis F family protein [Amantichitinum ursilacus]|uniref:rhamnan synthesis F family protein n=1 Tax=Amantichitinum ursilacus TaxID=857265 RepID=UPI001F185700|nr:rhamnan synthesis F family protein [Amantichitinum ursilacus]
MVCHLYYPDVWPELVTTLKRIKVPFDLIITTTAEQRQDVLGRVDAEYPQARIYLVENRGRDVGPLFKLLDYEPLQDYDLVLKLHTKKSLHQAEGHGDAWRAELYGGLVPADGIGSVLAFFDAHPEVGLVGTTGSMCSAARVAGSRGENLPGTREWAAKLGRDPDDLEYLFVAGNMFWARGLLFAALRELRVTQEDFDDEQGQVDGTLAHIMERVLPLVADLAGLKTAALPLPALPANVHTPVAVTAPYEQWLLQRAFTLNEAHLIDARRNQLPPQPLRLYIVDRIGNMAAVATSLTSLAEQYHKPVQAVIVSPLPNPDPTSQSGIGWLQGSGAYADLLADAQNASAAWVGFIEAGDRLTREGVLLGLVQAAVQPEWQLLYWDDDWLHENGAPDMPRLKPDFSPDLLRAMPYADGVVVARLGALQQALALGPLEAGAEQNDLICRVYEQHGVNAIAHIPELGVHLAQWPWRGLDEPNRAAAFARVIRDHLARIGQAATLEPGLIGGTLNVRYEHPTAPLVSILIPTKDQFSMISRCVTSLIEHNVYPLFEILVIDNNTSEPDAVAFLDGLIALNNPQIRVLRYPQPFNFSAMNNMAAREAKGEYLLLLNNDTAAIQDNWLEELVRIALRPDVGMVGPRLLYPDGRVQHAGVVLGLRGPADHPFIGMNRDERGYMNRLQVTQNYSAVTAACALIRTSLYHAVGGMDETAFKVSYNDVDLCLKVRAAGYLIVFTPHVSVMHEGSVSQRQLDPAAAQAKADRFRGEQDEMLQRWLPQLALDPYYNRNLLLHGNGFELDQRRPVTFRPISWTPPLRIMSHPADVMGCGNYRIMQPWNALEAAGMISGVVSMELLNPLDLRRIDPDVLVFQRQITEEQIGFMARSAQFQRAYRIYELDDYLPNLPIKSLHRHHMPKDILRSLRRAVQLTDRFVVSTERLAEAYSDLHNNFHVVHNYLPPAWWGNLPPQRSRGARPRVGWAGGISHTGDLELIVDVVREFAGTVDWVFFGMCPDKLRPYIAEYHEGVPIDRYPAKLASLKLDLALAPLEHNVFNECKSNLRLLEYGACGFATICTDIVPYQGDLPVTRVRNRHKDWADAIRMHLADLDATWAAGDALREAVLSRWMLQGENLGKWLKAWSPD